MVSETGLKVNKDQKLAEEVENKEELPEEIKNMYEQVDKEDNDRPSSLKVSLLAAYNVLVLLYLK